MIIIQGNTKLESCEPNTKHFSFENLVYKYSHNLVKKFYLSKIYILTN